MGEPDQEVPLRGTSKRRSKQAKSSMIQISYRSTMAEGLRLFDTFWRRVCGFLILSGGGSAAF
jgi:hypothetical protein